MKKYICLFLATVVCMNLFAKGVQDHTQWINHVISGEVSHSDSIKRIHIQNCYTVLTVKTVPDITSIQYKVRGIPDAFITIRNIDGEFDITETDMFPHKKRRTKRTVDAEMEVLIPQALKLEKVEIKAALGDAVVESLTSDMFLFHGSIGNAAIEDMQCTSVELHTSVGNVVFENSSCKDLLVKGGVGNTTVKKITCTNAELTGSVGKIKVEELICGELRLEGGVGKVTVTETNVEKKGSVVGSVGALIFSNCVLQNTNIKGGVGTLSFAGILKGECFIKSSVGKFAFTINAPASSYKIAADEKPRTLRDVSISGFDFENIFYGNQDAENILHLHSGIGKINIRFSDPA
ncbi:MAG: DUF4097 family beta strand repeat-containing protein [Treponema sp.]